jgi:siroheme synthase
VAVIENGARANEIRAFGSLGNVAGVIQSAGIQGPALLIIGEVVAVGQRGPGGGARSNALQPTLASLWGMLS